MEWRRPTTGRGLVVACLAVTLSVAPGVAFAQDDASARLGVEGTQHSGAAEHSP